MIAPTRPTLTLSIDGVPHDVRAFDYEEERIGSNGVEHSLRGPAGRRFKVYSADMEYHCERCGHDGCPHIEGLASVGLL